MNRWLDDAVVGVVLAASVLYAAYSLGPRAWRPRFLAGTAALLAHLPRFFGLRAAARRLEAAAAALESSCGGCDNCGSAGPSPAAGRSSSPTEVNVPLSKIGKRADG